MTFFLCFKHPTPKALPPTVEGLFTLMTYLYFYGRPRSSFHLNANFRQYLTFKMRPLCFTDGRKITIPDHGSKSVPHGLMIKIIRYDLEMKIEDFFED